VGGTGATPKRLLPVRGVLANNEGAKELRQRAKEALGGGRLETNVISGGF